MLHEIKYALKMLFRSKEFMFWTVAFPVILATLFHLALSNLGKGSRLQPISVAVIDDTGYRSSYFKTGLEKLSDTGSSDRVFNLQTADDEAAAEKLIAENKIVGYLKVEGNPRIVLGNNSIEATVFHRIITQMQQVATAIRQAAMNAQDADAAASKAIEVYRQQNYEIIEQSNSRVSSIVISFYSLIAMTCLYGAITGMFMISSVLPKMSQIGKRIAVSGTPKLKLVLSNAVAGYIGQWFAVSVLFVYLIFVLKLSFGDHLLLVYLFTLLGSLAGLAMGIFLASVINANEELKIGIIISVTMAGSFLSGMMSPQIKFYVDRYAPIINRINPANMITDGLYALSTYPTYDRFLFNVVSLIIFAALMLLLSAMALRRQTYDSI